MIDIIFIGAGPVGLLAAIDFQLQFPNKKVLMYEKYEVPTRNHAMYVDHKSFSNLNRSKGFGEILDNIAPKVIISDLEVILRKFATAIGIKILYQEINNFNELKQQYPDTQYFVGSGGLRGIIHPQIFNNENQINENIRYAVEVKYKALGGARVLNKFIEVPDVLANTKHVVSEYVGHLKNEVTPISLRIFIDASTYELMQNATFKNPYTLNDKDKIPVELYKTIDHYIKGRKHLAKETIQENSLKISTIKLTIYASKQFGKQIEGNITIFQLGEEAFACPFYRSFNDNASCIHFFTKAMDALLKNTQMEPNKLNSSSMFKSRSVEESPLTYYHRNVQHMIDNEIRTIHLLDTGLKTVTSTVNSLQKAPKISSSSLHLKPGGKDFLNDIHDEEETSSCTLW